MSRFGEPLQSCSHQAIGVIITLGNSGPGMDQLPGCSKAGQCRLPSRGQHVQECNSSGSLLLLLTGAHSLLVSIGAVKSVFIGLRPLWSWVLGLVLIG
ncbi:hypothetical protein TNCT_493281 [Trichonephila clavata]|uniref:Uncharacterized protein n=1 Tax=Trichonephila clavata TaxID=2740835 RepID=A0A8X6IRU4_TRICU|nr:hypothetical protein TNCT_493281 [Trichonephila clavata]